MSFQSTDIDKMYFDSVFKTLSQKRQRRPPEPGQSINYNVTTNQQQPSSRVVSEKCNELANENEQLKKALSELTNEIQNAAIFSNLE